MDLTEKENREQWERPTEDPIPRYETSTRGVGPGRERPTMESRRREVWGGRASKVIH